MKQKTLSKIIKDHSLVIRILRKITSTTNIALIFLFRIFPIDPKLIVLESEGDLSDNAFALYEYMKTNGYLNKYRVVWLVEDVKATNELKYENTAFVEKLPQKITVKRSKYLATCKYYIYDHCNLLPYKRHQGQKVIFLSHGCTFKGRKGANGEEKINVDEMYVTGKLFFKSMAEWANCDISRIVDIGYPRLDYLFMDCNKEQRLFKEKYNINNYSSVFIWLPTFRKSVNANLSEDYFVSETGLPIVYKRTQLKELNDFLNHNNSLCVLKLHHLQSDYDCFSEKFSNIIIIKDSDLKECGVQLYQLLSMFDSMITDYSSIGYEFLLLNRPLIYTLDDLEQYKQSRGLSNDNILFTMAGSQCYTLTDLESAMMDVITKNDLYSNMRIDMLGKCHTHTDGHASARILDHLRIIK